MVAASPLIGLEKTTSAHIELEDGSIIMIRTRTDAIGIAWPKHQNFVASLTKRSLNFFNVCCHASCLGMENGVTEENIHTPSPRKTAITGGEFSPSLKDLAHADFQKVTIQFNSSRMLELADLSALAWLNFAASPSA